LKSVFLLFGCTWNWDLESESGIGLKLETHSPNTECHPSVLREIRPHNSKSQFSDIQTIELELHLILILWLI
jgi:hypothetical protein